MKRLTALALAGVLLLGTACGGGNQANDAVTQAGAAATQDQTADGAEEAAAETAEAEEGTADPAASGDTEKTADEKTEYTSGGRPKSDAKGGKGDAITTEDENVLRETVLSQPLSESLSMTTITESIHGRKAAPDRWQLLCLRVST